MNTMSDHYDITQQFRLSPWDFFEKLDFINWYRFFFIIKAVGRSRPSSLLEIGPGDGTMKNVLEPFLDRYETMDVNDKLKPTYHGDVRNLRPELQERFDAIIAADILEHIPFHDLEKALNNLHSYLKNGGRAFITIPHRASNFLFMSPVQKPRAIRVPTGFCSPGAFYRRFIKRKVWIDPDHQWETGDSYHTIQDVEALMKKAGFHKEKMEKLLYVDFWVLRK